MQSEQTRGLNISQPPLTRLALIRLADDAYQIRLQSPPRARGRLVIVDTYFFVLSFHKAFSNDHDARLESSRPDRDYIAWLQQNDDSEAERFKADGFQWNRVLIPRFAVHWG